MGSPQTGFLNLFALQGTTALVTGAARGLGRAMSLALADAGADLVLLDREPMDEVSREVEERGARCRWRQRDLASLDQASAGEVVAWANRAFGGVSILVNNAGIIRRGPALELAESDWSAVVGLDLTVPFLLAQALAGDLAARNASGSIINMCSLNSFQGGFEVAAYAAAKHGLLGTTRALANEWSAKGIRVNAIAPGYFQTEFTRAHRDDPERFQAMLARIPAGRWGVPDDLAGAVVFLASRASSYVTGSVLTVDGGWTSR